MENKEFIRLSGIAHESLVNGPGLRRVLFSQGCKHNCENCFNKDTHSFEAGELKKIDEIVYDIVQNPIIKGVTFSGGDPLEQADAFALIAKKIAPYSFNIWCYTGYTFEYILQHKDNSGWAELIDNIDVLVDGKYIDKLKDDHLKYRGSRNQRIIDVRESIKSGEIKILDYDEK